MFGDVYSAYYSWRSRDVKIPPPPPLYKVVSDETKSSKNCCAGVCFCCPNSDASVGEPSTHLEKTPIPMPPNTFDFKKTANIIELLSLTLEFVQMASFALQRNPYSSSSDEDDVPTLAPTLSPSLGFSDAVGDDDDEVKFWGQDLFEVYLLFVEQFATYFSAYVYSEILFIYRPSM